MEPRRIGPAGAERAQQSGSARIQPQLCISYQQTYAGRKYSAGARQCDGTEGRASPRPTCQSPSRGRGARPPPTRAAARSHSPDALPRRWRLASDDQAAAQADKAVGTPAGGARAAAASGGCGCHRRGCCLRLHLPLLAAWTGWGIDPPDPNPTEISRAEGGGGPCIGLFFGLGLVLPGRGPYSHSALPCAAPIGILRINENGTREMPARLPSRVARVGRPQLALALANATQPVHVSAHLGSSM
jgi:hypothetical protein